MNTIRAVESLTRSGFSEEQARAVVGVVSDVVEESAATKLDFVELRAEMRGDIAALSRDLSRQIAAVDAKIDTKVAMLETGIANAKVQMVLYTGGIVAAITAVSKLFD